MSNSMPRITRLIRKRKKYVLFDFPMIQQPRINRVFVSKNYKITQWKKNSATRLYDDDLIAENK